MHASAPATDPAEMIDRRQNVRCPVRASALPPCPILWISSWLLQENRVAFHSAGLGWQPSFDDPRDYTPDHAEVQELIGNSRSVSAPARRAWTCASSFAAAEDQGPLNSSCAFAVLGLVEYFEARCHEPPLEASRLFLYQMALRLRGTTDDVGTDLRTMLKALRRFGSPPQPFWPYRPSDSTSSPPIPSCSASPATTSTWGTSARQRATIAHHRLSLLKSALLAGFPFVLGFLVPSTLSVDGLICHSNRSKAIRGGQSADRCRFDDSIRIASHKGGLLIRNSWAATGATPDMAGFPTTRSTPVRPGFLDRVRTPTAVTDPR